MFEQPAGKVEKDRSRMIMLMSGIAVLAVIALVVIVTSMSKKQAPLEFARAGTPEFDSYIGSVKVSGIEKRKGERLNVFYGRFIFTLENAGNRTINGLQMRMAAIDMNAQVVKEKLITVIPTLREPLGPGQSARLDLSFEPIPNPDELQDMTIEVYSLKTQ
ncbi:MAG TPA: hypothetical protein VJ464_04960 [Blastocatellia bacterium]|nr:hypothetical protein [Blastocatellia bacterium]